MAADPQNADPLKLARLRREEALVKKRRLQQQTTAAIEAPLESSAAASNLPPGTTVRPEGPTNGVLELPPAAPLPQLRFNLKTKVKRIRCNYKQFAPREFTGILGTGDRVIHKSHHLAGARGVIWCWRCGAYGTYKPRRLIEKCKGYPTQNGADNLSRLRKGLPPNHLKGVWPNPDTALCGQLKVV